MRIISVQCPLLKLPQHLGASTIVVVGCDKEGIEGALINTLNYVNILKSLGVNTTGVILNKLRVSYITDETNRP